MSLINCPECHKRISKLASHCPHCGYSLHYKESNHVTIERTKKKFKLQSLLSTIILIIGIIMLGNANNHSIAHWLIVIGLGWNILNGIRIWWHHG